MYAKLSKGSFFALFNLRRKICYSSYLANSYLQKLLQHQIASASVTAMAAQIAAAQESGVSPNNRVLAD